MLVDVVLNLFFNTGSWLCVVLCLEVIMYALILCLLAEALRSKPTCKGHDASLLLQDAS